MERLLRNLRFAGRSLRRTPGFTLVAVVTLALGIGANTAIYSVVRGVLLRPLPYAAPERLVSLRNAWTDTPVGDLSPAEYFDYRERLETVQSLGAYATGEVSLTGDAEPERVGVGYLSAGMWPTLGVEPLLGRAFAPEEDRPGAEAVALLSHSLWQRRYGGAADVAGRRIVVNGRPATVLGVMPAGFALPEDIQTGGSTELFVPLGMDRTTVPNRGSHFLSAVARLRPGATPEAAAADMAANARRMVADHPEDYSEQMRFTAGAVPLREAVLGEVRPVLLVLLGAVGLVLLIACANVANLLLARADGRRRELAVRAALGAGRGRLAAELLTESVLLALLGGAAGVVLAVWTLEALPLVQPPDLPRLAEVQVDAGVLAFALALSLLTALLFGLAPAIGATRPALHETLKEGGRGQSAGSRRQRFRAVLVAGEVALAVVLLLGAGLLLRSFAALYAVDPGFRAEQVLTLRLSAPSASYPDDDAVVRFYRELLGRLETIPGVSAAGAVTNLPLASTLGDLNFQIGEQVVAEGQTSPRADWQVVTPGYFEAVGMQVLRGRGIEPADDEGAPGAIVLNESLARRYWPGRDPIGQRLLLGADAGPGWVTVVGVVRDVRHAALGEAPKPEMYVPHAQFRHWNGGAAMRSLSVALRTAGDPLAAAGAVRAEIRGMDPNLPVSDLRSLEAVRGESVAQPRFLSLLLGLFSGIALLLAAVGIYGTLAYLVSQRTREIGVRMALGARGGEVVRLIVRQAMGVVLAGTVIGLLAGPALTRLLTHLLYGVAPTDALTFAAVPLVLGAAALLASYLPARRATRVDPVIALRAE